MYIIVNSYSKLLQNIEQPKYFREVLFSSLLIDKNLIFYYGTIIYKHSMKQQIRLFTVY